MLRLDILLSKWEPERLPEALAKFKEIVNLCRYALSLDSYDVWKKFDLADALFFSGEYPAARDQYTTAFDEIPQEERAYFVGVAMAPFRELIALAVLPAELQSRAEQLIQSVGQYL